MQEFSIQAYLNDTAILKQTTEQIQKEFSFFDTTILFDNSNNYTFSYLCEQILPQVKKLILADNQKLYAFLYRIDINEAQIKKESNSNIDKPFEEIISQLIIKRCLQKVVLRKLFSSND